MNADRERELRKILMEGRQEVAGKIIRKLHDIRVEGSEKLHKRKMWGDETPDDYDIQEDIELALIQMKVETLNRIDQALSRLDQNLYGHCSECKGEISEKRLRALPFAIRCKECEEAREIAKQRKIERLHNRG